VAAAAGAVAGQREAVVTGTGALKIDFLLRNLQTGGTQRHVAVLAPALRARGHTVRTLVFYGGGEFEQPLRQAGVEIVDLGKRGRWDNGAFVSRLGREIRRHRPDVVHGMLLIANLYAGLARIAKPGTRIVWGVRSGAKDPAGQDPFLRWAFRLSGVAARAAHAIIVNSGESLEIHARAGYPRDRLHLVRNGIDVERFFPDRAAGMRLRRQLGIPEDALLGGVVARLHPDKDHPTFLRAAARIAARRPDAHFLLVGDGSAEYRAELVRRATELGVHERIHWIPYSAEMREVYNALDYFCLSSRTESFPNAMAEAMACGVPCVSTNVGDAAYLVGDTGLIVPVGDPDALASGIDTLLSRDRTVLSRLARCRVVEEFGVKRMVDETERILCRTV